MQDHIQINMVSRVFGACSSSPRMIRRGAEKEVLNLI